MTRRLFDMRALVTLVCLIVVVGMPAWAADGIPFAFKPPEGGEHPVAHHARNVEGASGHQTEADRQSDGDDV
jgi:hypothetical protein